MCLTLAVSVLSMSVFCSFVPVGAGVVQPLASQMCIQAHHSLELDSLDFSSHNNDKPTDSMLPQLPLMLCSQPCLGF